MMKKLQIIFALVALVFTVAFAPSAASAATLSTNYTILGDSIAAGVGATNFYGYTTMYRDYLKTRYSALNTYNWAVPGFTTANMLANLKSNPMQRVHVKIAQETVISIGGNNLLGCASNNYSAIDTVCAEQGVQSFGTDFISIMKEIRGVIATNSKVYMMTLYNPYRGDEPLHAVAEPYIQRINAIINDPANIAAYNYRVVDAYSAFQGQEADGSWKVSKYTHFSEPTRDPHPTDAGHALLSELHAAKF